MTYYRGQNFDARYRYHYSSRENSNSMNTSDPAPPQSQKSNPGRRQKTQSVSQSEIYAQKFEKNTTTPITRDIESFQKTTKGQSSPHTNNLTKKLCTKLAASNQDPFGNLDSKNPLNPNSNSDTQKNHTSPPQQASPPCEGFTRPES